jgi:hypothetical protein
MKTKLLTVCIAVVICLTYSSNSFAQRDAGGTSSGGGSTDPGGSAGSSEPECVVQPVPVSFKRNNGQGTCGIDGQVRLTYAQNPSSIPVMIGLTYLDGSSVDNVVLPIIGDASMLAKKKYISYCIEGTNISPAKKLKAVFHYEGGCEDVVIQE